MQEKLMYIELKTGHNNNDPAWIGNITSSKTGNTIYFNNQAFKKGKGIAGNYYNVETRDEYWISGVKKDEKNRLSGSAKISIDKNAVSDYLKFIGKSVLDHSKYILTEIKETDISRFKEMENTTL